MKSILFFNIFLIFFTSCKSEIGTGLGFGTGIEGASTSFSTEVKQFDEVKISLSDFSQGGQSIVKSEESDLGVVQVLGSDVISYTHVIEDPFGKDSFIVDVENKDGQIERVKIAIAILENDLAPNALDDALSTKSGRSQTVDVLANDSDPKNEKLTLANIVLKPKSGTAEIVDGKILYTANPDYTGDDELVYQIENESGSKGAAKVLINVVENGGSVGGANELPMDIIFVFTSSGKSKVEGKLKQEADFILKTINDSQKFKGEVHNAYYLRNYKLIEDNRLGIATTSNYRQVMNTYGSDGVLNKIIVEDFSGGVLGIAHGIDCLIQKTGASCRSGSSSRYSAVITEYNSLHRTGGGCDAAPLGCTATHEVGHHLGWFHLSGESGSFVNYNRCNLTGVGYYRTTASLRGYNEELTDNNGVKWYTGPHAMRKGGGTSKRNGGFYPYKSTDAEGYPPNATEIHKCYNKLSNDNIK